MQNEQLHMDAYRHQGYRYNRDVLTPDGSGLLGGGCMSSSARHMIAAALVYPAFPMEDFAKRANQFDLSFSDFGYAERIAFATVPVVVASMLGNYFVEISTTPEALENDRTSKSYYGRENYRTYTKLPVLSNLKSSFEDESGTQLRKIISVLGEGGMAIPLVQPKILFNSQNPEKAQFVHAVVLAGYDEKTNEVVVVDPNPGFSDIPKFHVKRKREELLIAAGRIKSFSSVQRVAAQWHPKRSVQFKVKIDELAKSMLGAVVTAAPK